MYEFYCNDTLFFKSGIDDKRFTLADASGTFEKEKGKIKVKSLSFTLPHTNIVYDSISKLNSIITVKDSGEEIFRGRVLYDEKDFFKNKKIVCEGELAFLLDSVKRPFTHQGSVKDFFTDLIENHNSQVEEKKRFVVGNVTVTDDNDYINRSSVDYMNTYDAINDKLIKTHGGFIKTRVTDGVRYIDYLEDYGEKKDQVIEFGVNLLDIKEHITAENVFTCLIPLGKKDETTEKRLTIENVNGGSDYLQNSTGVELFGKIFAIETWDDVTVASNLKSKGQAFLDASIEMAVTLTLKAVDLHLIDANIERIEVGDKMRVLSLPHNLDKYFECTKVTINFLNPKANEYTFGSLYKTLTDPSDFDNKYITYVEDAITKVEKDTDTKLNNFKDTNLTQAEIMNIITDNGKVEGVYLVDGQIWIKGTYIDVDKLSAISANLGSINGGSININDMFFVTDEGIMTAKGGHFEGKVTATSGNISNFEIKDDMLKKHIAKTFDFTEADYEKAKDIIMETVEATEEDIARLDVNKDGNITATDYLTIKNYVNAGNNIDVSMSVGVNEESDVDLLKFHDNKKDKNIFRISAFGKTIVEDLTVNKLSVSTNTIEKKVSGKTHTVDVSNITGHTGNTFAFLVVMRSWVSMNGGGKAVIYHGIQKQNYVSYHTLFNGDYAGSVSLNGTTLTINFYDNNGGGYAIYSLI